MPVAVGPSDSTGADGEADVDTTIDGSDASGNVFYEGQTEVGGPGPTVSGTSKKRVRHPKLPDKPLDFQVNK